MKNKLNSRVLNSIKLLLFASLILNAASAWANMAAPSQGAILTSEPNGLEKIYIRRERLTLDFRGVAETQASRTVAVEAVYDIENTDADKTLKLIFVLGINEVKDFNFYLDEQLLPSKFDDYSKLPKQWKAPLSTPWHDNKTLGFFPSDNIQKTALIELTIPKGRHVLKAQYNASPATYSGFAPRQLYQFAYVLAPARNWAGFGGLDLTILMPEGWELITAPAMEQTGATMQKHFDQIPADALGFTFGKPLPPGYYQLDEVFFWLALASVFVPPFLLGWLFIRQNRRGIVNPVMGFLLSLGWGILVGAAIFAASFGADYIYPTITYGYGGLFSFIFLFIMAAGVFVSGGFAWLLSAVIFNKRKTPPPV